jgi:hypothetical protein
VRPFLLAADDRLPTEIRALGAADADTVTYRFAAGLDQIEPAFGHVDDDAARLLLAVPGDLLAQQARIDGGHVDRRGDEAAVADGAIIGGDATGQHQRQACQHRAPAQGMAQRVAGETVLGGRILAGRLTHGELGCSYALCAASASHATAHSANRQSVIRQPPRDRRVTPCLIHLNVTVPIL